MARGIIRTNNGNSTRSSAGYTISTGTLEDTQSKVQYEFEQPFFDELGLNVGEKVSYSVINSNGKDLAIGLEPIERGVVQSVTTDGGTLKERANGTVIDFAHPRVQESKIVAGSVVRYEKVDFNGKPVATSLTLIR
jgi:hypothetical protein